MSVLSVSFLSCLPLLKSISFISWLKESNRNTIFLLICHWSISKHRFADHMFCGRLQHHLYFFFSVQKRRELLPMSAPLVSSQSYEESYDGCFLCLFASMLSISRFKTKDRVFDINRLEFAQNLCSKDVGHEICSGLSASIQHGPRLL